MMREVQYLFYMLTFLFHIVFSFSIFILSFLFFIDLFECVIKKDNIFLVLRIANISPSCLLTLLACGVFMCVFKRTYVYVETEKFLLFM